MSDIKQQNNYNEESIDDISQIEGARLRPQSIGFEGHSHIFTEQLANSIDEAREGYGKVIEITKYEDYSISVRDYGRSIPLDFNLKTQKYNWKTIFMTMWGGGKYLNSNNKEKSNYSNSLGTNGAGNFGSATTSQFFEVWSYKGSECHNIRFEEGKIVKEFNKYQDNSPIGTKTYFKPDIKCYGEDIIDDEFITDMLKRQSIINGGIKFIYINKKDNYTKEYYYKNGILDYIREISKEKEFTNIYNFKGESFIPSKPQDFEANYEIYFTFNNEINQIEYYHNSSYLPNGGLPEKVLKSAMVDVFDKYIKTNNLYKKGEKIKFEDIIDSLILVFSSGSTTSVFADQTKKSIDHKELQKVITEEFKSYLEVLLIENKLEADKIANQILINKRANDKALQSKLDLKKKLQVKTNGLSPKIEGLKDCDMRNSELEEREFYITEGVSPSSTVIDARDPRIMGVYGLRGKFISSLKNSIKDVLNNEPALGIINGLGCGIELSKEDRRLFKNINTFNIENLRYGKVFISTDMDEWGYGIALSLITFFYKFMPKLLEQGRIYLSVSPRYEIETSKKDKKGEFITYFAYSEQDKEKIINELENENVKYIINIVKGLGQLDKDVFWHYVLNKENRISKQIICKNINDENLEILFNTLMGDDIVGRKKYVKENITGLNIQELD